MRWEAETGELAQSWFFSSTTTPHPSGPPSSPCSPPFCLNVMCIPLLPSLPHVLFPSHGLLSTFIICTQYLVWFCCFSLFETGSLCCPASLDNLLYRSEIHLCLTSGVLGLTACTTTPRLYMSLHLDSLYERE